jgi:hypothetical protein
MLCVPFLLICNLYALRHDVKPDARRRCPLTDETNPPRQDRHISAPISRLSGLQIARAACSAPFCFQAARA